VGCAEMSTLTPTSDSTQIVDYTSPKKGDLVVGLDNKLSGKVGEINFKGVPSMVFVFWDNQTSSAVSVLRLRRA